MGYTQAVAPLRVPFMIKYVIPFVLVGLFGVPFWYARWYVGTPEKDAEVAVVGIHPDRILHSTGVPDGKYRAVAVDDG